MNPRRGSIVFAVFGLGAVALLTFGCGGSTFESASRNQDGGAGTGGLQTGGGGSGAGGATGSGAMSSGGARASGGMAGAGAGGFGVGGTAGSGGVGGGVPCGSSVCAPGSVCCAPECGFCSPGGEVCPPIHCIDAAPPPVQCGAVTCGSGERCCDPACGTCAPIGAECVVGCGTPDGGSKKGPRCGRSTFCSVGQACCDSSCGQCGAALDQCVVTNHFCPPDCTAMEVKSICNNTFPLGYYWNGSACLLLTGCCAGKDCDFLFSTKAECDSTFALCPVAITTN
jgi:hypothetical protein